MATRTADPHDNSPGACSRVRARASDRARIAPRSDLARVFRGARFGGGAVAAAGSVAMRAAGFLYQ